MLNLVLVATEAGIFVGVVVLFNLFVLWIRGSSAPAWLFNAPLGMLMGVLFSGALFGSLALLTIGLIKVGVSPFYAWIAAAGFALVVMNAVWMALGVTKRLQVADAHRDQIEGGHVAQVIAGVSLERGAD